MYIYVYISVFAYMFVYIYLNIHSFLIGAVDPCFASTKLINLEPTAMAKIVGEDITVRQALATADFTRDIYDEKCTFQVCINGH
jgi:hypothetical protein